MSRIARHALYWLAVVAACVPVAFLAIASIAYEKADRAFSMLRAWAYRERYVQSPGNDSAPGYGVPGGGDDD